MNINVNNIGEDTTLQLEGDQYNTYTLIMNSITGSQYISVHFFITDPGGTGKSFLLKSLEAWYYQLK